MFKINTCSSGPSLSNVARSSDPAARQYARRLSSTARPEAHLRPKLAAAGADLQRVRFQGAKLDACGLPLRDLASDLDRLRMTLSATGGQTRCVVIDHLSDYFRFAEKAAAAGVDGAITVDLPPEEAGEFGPALVAHGIDQLDVLIH